MQAVADADLQIKENAETPGAAAYCVFLGFPKGEFFRIMLRSLSGGRCPGV